VKSAAETKESMLPVVALKHGAAELMRTLSKKEGKKTRMPKLSKKN